MGSLGLSLLATSVLFATTQGFVVERLERIEQLVQDRVDRGEIPGAVVLLARHGKVGLLRSFGFRDVESRMAMKPDDLFRLASATKILTSAALLTLYEEGRLRLRDPVAEYIPELMELKLQTPEGGLGVPERRLTVRDLLRHTAGYGYGFREPQGSAYRRAGIVPSRGPGADLDWRHGGTLSEWAARLATVPLADEPGTRFEYGLGSDVAGLLIERISNQRLDRFLRERLLVPLGMNDTGFVVPEEKLGRLTSVYRAGERGLEALDRAETSEMRRTPDAFSGGGGWDNLGNGGLYSTAQDMLRFLQMLLNGGELEGTRVLSRKTVEMMFENHLAGLPSPEISPGVGFGLGYAVVTDPARHGEVVSEGMIWWAGSTNVHYWLAPKEGLIGLYFMQVLPFGHLDLMDRVRLLSLHALE
jgi:CubicO group peptidase (beta-lactamase class C family)